MADEIYTKQGVRNLDVMLSDKHREMTEARREAERRCREAEQMEREGHFSEIIDIHDLLYDNTQELREEILSVWPEARLNGVYDDIHESRLEVDLQASELSWIKWLIRSGWAAISIRFQLYLFDNDKDKHTLIEIAMDQEAPGWRKRKSK